VRDIGRLVLVLGLIGFLSAAALAFVRTSLAPRIEQQEDFYVRGPALVRLFERPANELLANKIKIETSEAEYPVFYLTENGEVIGLAVEAAGRGGYGGDIIIMIGFDVLANSLLGVEIVAHSETPGLGSRVEKESFRQQWEGLTATEDVTLRSAGGRIDAISGATFSSRAMIDGTNRVIGLLREHTDAIMARIAEQPLSGGAS